MDITPEVTFTSVTPATSLWLEQKPLESLFRGDRGNVLDNCPYEKKAVVCGTPFDPVKKWSAVLQNVLSEDTSQFAEPEEHPRHSWENCS